MSMIPVPRNMKIQSMNPQMKIEFFTDEEIERMKNYIQMQFKNNNKRSEVHKRYFALIITLLRTGGRIDEVLALKAKDFSFENDTVRLITLKRRGEVYRVIPMHPELRTTILKYFLNSHIDPKSDDRVFKTTRQAVDKYFKKMQLSLGFKIHAHKFRHTFAVKAMNSYVPLNVLQKWLGHASVFTTNVYTEITGIDTRGFMELVK